jgi:hypothetical protein
VYTFLTAASLSLTVNGLTYSTSARPDNPIEIVAEGGDGFDQFIMSPQPISLPESNPNTPDAANPLPAFPYIEFHDGTGALPNGALPTTSFPAAGGHFNDPAVFLSSAGAPFLYRLKFLAGPVTITTVPEPAALGLMLLGAGAIGRIVLRRRLS